MTNKTNQIINEVKKFGLIFMPINWVICAIVTIILFQLNESYGYGYLLGSITSYLTFGLHMKHSNDYGSEKANSYMQFFTNAGVRFIISAAMLFIAFYFNDLFNFICAAIGILVIKVLLIIFGIIYEIVNSKKKKESDAPND